jgi:hypothetical protein
MNTTGPHIEDRIDERIDEREWQAQERALREARDGAPASGDDGMASQYRHIAEALREPPAHGLPANFAAQVAARAAAAQTNAAMVDTRLERALLRGLAIALALSGVVALAFYGAPLAAQSLSVLGSEGAGWLLALGACVAVSWSFDWLRRRLQHHGDRLQAA